MDEKKEEKKKESIDEILSDLNGLLNKMPAILEGIKLPEIKPAEPAAAPAEEPVRNDPLPVPGKKDILDQTLRLDASELPPDTSGGSVDKMVLQSLGDFMFSAGGSEMQGAKPQLSEPLALPLEPVDMESAPELPEIKPLSEGTMPDADQRPSPAGGDKEQPAETAAQADPIPGMRSLSGGEPAGCGSVNSGSESGGGAAASPFESTRDFGVPDIDAMLSLFHSDAPADPASAAGSGPDLENFTLTPGGDAAGEQGGAMDLKNEPSGPQDEMDKTIPGLGDAAPEPVEAPLIDAAQQPEAETAVPEQQPGAGLPGEGFTLQPVEAAPAPSVSGPVSSADEEKTMIIAPPPAGPDGEKTVIFEAGATLPGATQQAAYGETKDFGALAAKTAPDGVSPDRVRGVAFIYAREDEALCADMLAALDAVCLKSSSNPMFISRALVEACEAGTNGNVVMQKVVDAKAVGLVCLGAIPQETVYELENVFTAAGVFFKHLTRENFNHSATLDLVMEFILK